MGKRPQFEITAPTTNLISGQPQPRGFYPAVTTPAPRLGGEIDEQGGREMPYKITFEPLNRIAGVKPTTVEIETAAKAWMEVASDERGLACVLDPHFIRDACPR
jgi:hypothetical protein